MQALPRRYCMEEVQEGELTPEQLGFDEENQGMRS